MTNLPAKPLDAGAILSAYLQGRKTKEIAPEYGKSPEELRHYLVSEQPERWKQARLAQAITRLDDATEAIDQLDEELRKISAPTTPDGIREMQTKSAVANVRLRVLDSKLKSAQWEMEKVCRAIYGEQKQEPLGQPIQINIGITRGDGGMAIIGASGNSREELEKAATDSAREYLAPAEATQALPHVTPEDRRAAKKNLAAPTSNVSAPLVYEDQGFA